MTNSISLSWYWPLPTKIKLDRSNWEFDFNEEAIEEFKYRYAYPEDTKIHFDLCILVTGINTEEIFHTSLKNVVRSIKSFELDSDGLHLELPKSNSKLYDIIYKGELPNTEDKRPNFIKLFQDVNYKIAFCEFAPINGIVRPHALCLIPENMKIPDHTIYCGARGALR